MPRNLQAESDGGLFFILLIYYNGGDYISSHGTTELFLSNFLDKIKGDFFNLNKSRACFIIKMVTYFNINKQLVNFLLFFKVKFYWAGYFLTTQI